MVDWFQRRFPDVFAGAENGVVPPEFCVVPAGGRNIVGSRKRRGDLAGGSGTLAIKIPVGAGNLPACPRCLVPSQLVHSPSATAGAWSSSSRTPVSPAPKAGTSARGSIA